MQSESHGSGSGDCGLQSRDEFAKARLLFRLQGEQREAREAATVAAQVHDVLQAGDAGFGDDGFRSANQNGLQFTGFFVVALADQFE